MRNAPLNYIITLAVGGLMWLGTGYWTATYLRRNVSLLETTVGYFVSIYRIVLAVAAVIGLLICYLWYYYGSRDTTAGDLDRAKSIWTISFFGQLMVAILAVIALVFIFQNAIFTTTQYVIFFTVMSAHTYLFYWLCTLFLSPRTVKYIPWGMR